MERYVKISYAFKQPFNVEKISNIELVFENFRARWHYSFYLCAVYVIIMFSIQRYMKNRNPLQLHKQLMIWNCFQAIFNVCLFIRSGTELLCTIWTHGFHNSLCYTTLYSQVGIFYMWLFYWSKVWDFCDTLFIVLRKRPLTYLHVIHHTLTLIITWYFCAEEFSLGPFIAFTNVVVHSIMYSYYALKSFNISIPEFISMLITFVQMVQLFLNTVLPMYIASNLLSGEKCIANYLCCFICSVANGLYFILFADFFHKTYFSKKKPVAVPLCYGMTEKQK